MYFERKCCLHTDFILDQDFLLSVNMCNVKGLTDINKYKASYLSDSAVPVNSMGCFSFFQLNDFVCLFVCLFFLDSSTLFPDAAGSCYQQQQKNCTLYTQHQKTGGHSKKLA